MNDRRRAPERLLVIGGGVTGLVAALRAAEQGWRVTVLEASSRLGGKVITERSGGYVVEGGPDRLATGKPAVRDLVQALDLADHLLPVHPGPAGHILRSGRAVEIPDGLAVMVPQRLRPLMTSPLLSPAGRARAALEIVTPRRRGTGDETLESFVVRRLGRQAYERLADPLVGSIHAGDVSTLSIQATFPHLHADEARHGGLARAVIRRRLDARTTSRRRRTSGAPRPVAGESAAANVSMSEPRRLPGVAAPRDGMTEIVRALERRLLGLGVTLQVDVRAVELAPGGTRDYLVHAVGGGALQLEADAVVLAVPAAVAARLCTGFDPELGARLSQLPAASVTAVSLAYRDSDVRGLPPGQALLVPSGERRLMRACTVASRAFDGRAPQGATLLRVLLGAVLPDDAAAVAAARRELGHALGVTAEPVMTQVRAWEGLMPRYPVGHRRRVELIRQRLQRWPGLAVAGSAFDGAGLPDCIASAQQAVRSLGSSRTDLSAISVRGVAPV